MCFFLIYLLREPADEPPPERPPPIELLPIDEPPRLPPLNELELPVERVLDEELELGRP